MVKKQKEEADAKKKAAQADAAKLKQEKEQAKKECDSAIKKMKDA